MQSKQETFDFGQFLVSVDLIDQNKANEMKALADRLSMPVFKAFELSGAMEGRLVEPLYRLYSIGRTTTLPPAVVQEAARLIVSEQMTVEKALATAGISGQIVGYSRLGVLLTEAGFINQEQLQEARKISYETGFPLGRVLIYMGAIDEPALDTALALQNKLRQRQLTKDEALIVLKTYSADAETALKAATQPHSPTMVAAGTAIQSPPTLVLSKARFRQIDILLLSGAITEFDLLDVVDAAMRTSTHVNEVLISRGLVSSDVLSLCCDLQKSLEEGALQLDDVTNTIRYIVTSSGAGSVPDQSSAGPAEQDLRKLLVQSGLINDAEIDSAVKKGVRNTSILAKMLVHSGVVDESAIVTALRCLMLVNRGEANLTDAAKALRAAVLNQSSLSDALQEVQSGAAT